jgi:hypothetical protein
VHAVAHGHVLHIVFKDLVVDARALLRLQRGLDGLLVPLEQWVVYHLRCKLLHGYANHTWLRLLGRGGQDFFIFGSADQPHYAPLPRHGFLVIAY